MCGNLQVDEVLRIIMMSEEMGNEVVSLHSRKGPQNTHEKSDCKLRAGSLEESSNEQTARRQSAHGVLQKVLFLVFYVAVLPVHGQLIPIDTAQVLPKECHVWMKEHDQDCPARNDVIHSKDWDKLNTICCSANNKTVLHCQTDYFQNWTQYSIKACLEDHPVPPGYFPKLTRDKSGNPKIDIRKCEKGHFSLGGPNTSFFLFPYCHRSEDNLPQFSRSPNITSDGDVAKGSSTTVPPVEQDNTADKGSESHHSSKPASGDWRTATIVLICVIVILFLILGATCFIWYRHYRSSQSYKIVYDRTATNEGKKGTEPAESLSIQVNSDDAE